MSGERHVLANGLTVAVDPLPGAESVALGLYAGVGSRSEPERLSGLAHLVEHMVFKGAGGRDTSERRHDEDHDQGEERADCNPSPRELSHPQPPHFETGTHRDCVVRTQGDRQT